MTKEHLAIISDTNIDKRWHPPPPPHRDEKEREPIDHQRRAFSLSARRCDKNYGVVLVVRAI
jgi:asparagine synthetase B (glutamine-hydrolysing)